MIDNKLSLLQLCDSNFPTGAFSHSYGLETYIQENKVYDKQSFSNWLEVYLNEQLTYSDGLACLLVYQALEQRNFQKIWDIDRMITVQSLPREVREGNRQVGRHMLKLLGSLYNADIISLYSERINKKLSFGHPCIAFTIIAHQLEVDKSTAILYYLYSSILNLVQNAVRGIPLGQTAGQQIIQEFQDKLHEATMNIENLHEDDFGIVSPGLELSQMKHERVNIRIFMS
ncbi:urease accessory protein UreF [Priestia megaterium]|uniref:urease accessory protein UreF n=1 Tax=Priestia megaterium TaxID=1404 RepID=UPI001B39D2CC|nr:urease accessory protein UreF [Priestia megaterium]MBQ4870371.1 urease accessory protein UreF [Priestia megaterium]